MLINIQDSSIIEKHSLFSKTLIPFGIVTDLH